jgi:general secretion pathway protein G
MMTRPLPAALRRRRVRARGVTLVEVLIVVAILSLIAGGVAIFAIPKFQQAQKDTAKTDAKTLVQVIETYRLSHSGSECPTIEMLKADKALKADQNVNDPWGKPYIISCSAEGDGVQSWGPDGKGGNEDDIWAGARPK